MGIANKTRIIVTATINNLYHLYMNLPLLLKNLPVCLIFIAIFTGCHSPVKPGTYANDKIPASQASNFHDLNKQLFEGLKANSKKQLSGLLSKEMIDNNSNLKDIEVVSNHMKEGDFTLQEEYYLVKRKPGKDTLKINNKDINNHKIGVNIDQPETYLAFFGQKGIANGQLVTLVYKKLDYGWKLTDLEIDPYSINGKTAPELFKQAKDDYAKGYLVNAVNLMAEARTTALPYISWVYPEEKQINEFYAKVLNAANRKYRFPYTINVATKPQIINLQIHTTPEGVFPQVFYRSNIRLTNTAGLLKENLQVRKALATALPGINKGNKYVFYSVFNKLPNSYESVDRYEVTDTIK